MLAAAARPVSDLCMWSPQPIGRVPICDVVSGSPRATPELSRHLVRTLLPFWPHSLAEVRFFRSEMFAAPSHAGAHPGVAVPHPPPYARTAIGRRVIAGVVAVRVRVVI